jgi:hypothetical protein
MTVWCGAIALFGIIIAGAGLDATSQPIYIVLSLLNPSEKVVLSPHLRFSLAVLGAVTIGWSLTLLTVIEATKQLDQSNSKTIWILVTIALMGWYVIDSSLSIATGFGFNAIANTGFIVTFLIPLLSSGVLNSQKSDHLQ